MTFLDTNIFLRFLTRDDEPKAEACRELSRRLDAVEERTTTLESVIAEVVYVLSARTGASYELYPAEIGGRLKPLLRVGELKLSHKGGDTCALNLYVAHPFCDFEDAHTLAHMRRLTSTELLSFKKDFHRVAGSTQLEPATARPPVRWQP